MLDYNYKYDLLYMFVLYSYCVNVVCNKQIMDSTYRCVFHIAAIVDTVHGC